MFINVIKPWSFMLFVCSLLINGYLCKAEVQINHLLKRNKKLVNELVYMHTDREVYAPGDTVWFKAYVRNKALFTKSELSMLFQVDLLNSKYESVFNAKYVIGESSAIGYIPLSGELKQGNYHINYYSSWMKNFMPKDVGLKQVFIKKDIPDEFRLLVLFDKTRYFPGDTVNYKVNCLNKKDGKISDIKYTCKTIGEGETLQKEKGKTISSDTLMHRYMLSDSISGKLQVQLTSTVKGKLFSSDFTIPVCNDLHLGFYPEGGNCFNGVFTGMAFKTVGSDGKPVYIIGNIVDEEGERVSENIASQHDGMGKFMFMAKKHRNFYFEVMHPASFAGRYELPKGKDTGYYLTAEVKNDTICASVYGRAIPAENITLTIMVRDYLVGSVSDVSKNMKNLKIPCADLPKGIAVLSVFDSSFVPVAERLLYLPYAHAPIAQIKTDKESYDRREKVLMDIQVTERSRGGVSATLNDHSFPVTERSRSDSNHTLPMQLLSPKGASRAGAEEVYPFSAGGISNGDFSLTIYDDYLGGSLSINNPNMASSFLLSPEIEGVIHNPAYYLSGDNDTVLANLDLLLLTQGWRNYEKLCDSLAQPISCDAISGTLLHHPWARSPKPFPDNEVFFSLGGITTKIKTDKNGRFYALPDYTSSVLPDIVISAQGKNDNKYVSIELDSMAFTGALAQYYDSLNVIFGDSTVQQVLTFHNFTEHFYNYNDKNHIWLDAIEVATPKVKKQRRPSDEIPINTDLTSRLSAATIYAPEVIQSYGLVAYNDELPDYDPIDSRHQKIRYQGEYIPVFYKINDFLQYSVAYKGEGMVRTTIIPDMGMVEYLKVEDIQEYVVAKGMAASSIIGADGILVYITTKPSAYKKESLYNNEIILKGFLRTKQKYNPIYDTKEKKDFAVPDFRKTLYWQPNIKIDKNGRTQVSFYTGDRFTKAKYILEGITNNGVPVYCEGLFEISDD
ncbi:hypothetical protein OAO55_02645 [Bacteroidales bacterium]|nr:hypothetical protein [Bacteroidales bacterium]